MTPVNLTFLAKPDPCKVTVISVQAENGSSLRNSMPFFRIRTDPAGTVRHWVEVGDKLSGLFSIFLALILAEHITVSRGVNVSFCEGKSSRKMPIGFGRVSRILCPFL